MIGYRQFRRLIFWTFVVLFFVTASSVLFYAFGYRYSFDRGIFVYSGSITLETTPDTVVVKIDGEIIPKQRIGFLNNSIHIAGLMPGEHFIEVSAPGYQTWAKRAIVSSGVSTEFWNVLLPREVYILDDIPDTNTVTKVFPDQSGNRLAFLIQNNEETSVTLFDQATGDKQQVYASRDLHFNTEHFENIEWSPSGNRLILPLFDKSDRFQPVIIDVRSGETILISDLVEGEIRNLRFDYTQSETVLFIADQRLFRLSIDRNRIPEFLAEDVDTYDLSGDFTYIARLKNGGIYRFRSGTNAETLTQVAPLPSLPRSTGWYSLIVYDDERLALLERFDERRLLVFNGGLKDDYGFRELDQNINGVQFSDDGKKLLYFSQNGVSVYFTREWEVQPAREENSIVQIARFSDPIGGVQWTEDYEHILFYQNGTVKLIELDSRDRRVISDLIILGTSPSQMILLPDENRLFFVEPGRGLSFITFPEPQGLFGQ